MGSLGFVAASRIAFLIEKHPDRPDVRLLLSQKNNLAPATPTLGYIIGLHGLRWEAETFDLSADQVIAAELQRLSGEQRPMIEEAKDWLLEVLAEGPVHKKEIQKLAADNGITERTLRRAKKALGVESRREGGGKGSRVFWDPPHRGPAAS